MSWYGGPVRRAVLDGLPVFWIDAPPPFAAGLLFRAGRCDETLPRGGITHLVEHLALPIDAPPGVQFNGIVDSTTTTFWAEGRRDAVLDLLAGTAARLGDLPLERLETERRILLTEAGAAQAGPTPLAMLLRYGPNAHGLVGYDEYGLRTLDADAVAAWARERFTRGNAALWLTGPSPDELPFGLPEGPRFAPPEPAAIPYLEFPAAYGGGPPGGAAVALEGERTSALAVAMSIASVRARRRLRHGEGVSYEVSWWYEWLTGRRAHVTLLADSLEENVRAVGDGLVAVLQELAEAGPTPEEVARDAEDMRAAAEDPDAARGRLAYAAAQELFEVDFDDEEELLRRRAEVAPEEGASAVHEALQTMLLLLPPGVAAPPGLTEYSLHAPDRVEGRRHRPRAFLARRRAAGFELVAGEEGVTLETPESRSTVRFDACAALLRWEDGTRALWSDDGWYLQLDPSAWRGGDDVVPLVDARVPAERVVQMEPERAERVAAVADLVYEKVPRGFMNSTELDRLPDVLERGERLVTAANATRGWKAGLLVATDRRLLFLYVDDVLADAPFDGIRHVRTRPGGLFRDNAVIVETEPEVLEFTAIKPAERRTELVDHLQRRRTHRPPPPAT